MSWVPNRPDIQEGDWVYGMVNRGQGYTSTVRIGSISGTLDVEADTVSGTISVPWFSETLNASCSVWQENGPGEEFQVDPNGGSYFCDFTSMGSGWDLLPGQNVGVQYREPDGNQVSNVFHAPAANVQIEKWAAGGGQAMPGGTVVFRLRYGNQGDAVAATIRLTDTLPSDTTYVTDSSGVTPTVGLDSVVWILGPLGPGEERQFQLVLSNTAQLGDVLVNSADIWTLYDQDPWNNHAVAQVDVTAGLPDVYVNKNPNPGDPAPGQTMLWEIGYGNNGPVYSGPVILTDTLPANTTIVEWRSENGETMWADHSTASHLILEAPALPGHWGDRILLRLLVDAGVPVGTQLTNTVEIATAVDVDWNNNRQTRDDVKTNEPRWDSMVDKNFGGGLMVPGGEVNYNLHIRNNGNMATHTVLTDTLPQGVSLSQAMDCSGPACVLFPPESRIGQVAVWDLGLMEPGAWAQLSVRADIGDGVQPGAVLTNCAELAIDGQESRPDDNSDCVVDRVNGPGPSLRIDKEYRWNWQGQLQYEIQFWNLGTTTLNNVKITDTLPANTSFSNNWSHWFPEGMQLEQLGNQLIWTIGSLEPAEGSGLRYEVNLDAGVVGVEGLCYTNTAVAPIPGDVWPGDNQDVTTACTGPDVYVEKWLSGGVPEPGAIVTFTVEFGNKSPWPWDGDNQYPSHITETLPAGMTFITATAPWNPADIWHPQINDDNTVVWGWGPMGANNWWRFDVVAAISDTVTGGQVLTNTVSAKSDSPDDVEPDNANNAFALPVTVLAPIFNVSKAYETNRVAGTIVTYTLSVTNSGNATATGAVLSDTLPAGLTYLDSDGSHDGAGVAWSLAGIAGGGGTAEGWFSALLQCQAGQDVVNDTYGVVRSDQGVRAWGAPASFTTLTPTIGITLAHGPEPALTGQTVYFTATATTDGTLLNYQWDLGEGAAGGGLTASRVFSEAGSYEVSVAVTDTCGYAKTALATVNVDQSQWMTFLPVVIKNN